MGLMKLGSPGRRRCINILYLAYFCAFSQQVEYISASENPFTSLLTKPDTKDNVAASRNTLQLDSEQEAEFKRRGSSFFPLRGKKYSLENAIADHEQMLTEESSEDKRSQFYPLRGKKIPSELKRASYFMPMRGRKDDNWVPTSDDITDEIVNKRASYFMPMRGKKSEVNSEEFSPLGRSGMYLNRIHEVIYPPSSHSSAIVDKRTSSFLPVRGKRSIKTSSFDDSSDLLNSVHGVIAEAKGNTSSSSDEQPQYHTTKKRSVSFMPMRGRRESDDPNGNIESPNTYSPEEITASFLDKNQYFMPMSGLMGPYTADKNSSEDISYNDLVKKGVSFMPMRGRRLFELDNTQNDIPSTANDADLTDVYLRNDKRAQSFMPMRGRRFPEQDIYHKSNLPSYIKSALGEKRLSFMPMRGRRMSEEQFNNDLGGTNWLDDGQILEPDPDKKASSFTLMRGRRFQDDPNSEVRATSDTKRLSFTPMRGRRVTDDATDIYSSEDDLDKRASSFMPMRGRRSSAEYGSYALDDLKPQWTDNKRRSSFMPMRGRRYMPDLHDSANFYSSYPFLMPGIGSSLMSRPYSNGDVSILPGVVSSPRNRRLKINWDSVKRAFHATRGKRFDEVHDFVNTLKDNYYLGTHGSSAVEADNSRGTTTRVKRNAMLPRVTMKHQRQYIALKRPMSFFATRGKRLDHSIDKDHKQG